MSTPEPQPAHHARRRLRPRADAIAVGAIVGVAGVPLTYVALGASGVMIGDAGLVLCLALPTVLLLLACLVPRARGWALQAAIASALASVALVAFVAGGITLITMMISDPA